MMHAHIIAVKKKLLTNESSFNAKNMFGDNQPLQKFIF